MPSRAFGAQLAYISQRFGVCSENTAQHRIEIAAPFRNGYVFIAFHGLSDGSGNIHILAEPAPYLFTVLPGNTLHLFPCQPADFPPRLDKGNTGDIWGQGYVLPFHPK